ncbi:MAG: hypothetical protein ACR2FJ_00425 [Qipengyuania sp.]
MSTRLIACCAPLVLLAACGADPEEEASEGLDPASEQALNEDLMTDPDLAGSNEANAALSGSADSSVPNIDRSPQAVASARSRAVQMVGGPDALRPAPSPQALSGNQAATPAMTQAARAAVSPGGENCAEQVKYTTSWAAKLPGAFPVYPRGSTIEAAGTDVGSCALRVVTFRTPVALDDVLAFYNTRAVSNGYSSEHVTAAGDNILSGVKGDAAFVIYARRLSSGLTEIDLVTSTP